MEDLLSTRTLRMSRLPSCNCMAFSLCLVCRIPTCPLGILNSSTGYLTVCYHLWEILYKFKLVLHLVVNPFLPLLFPLLPLIIFCIVLSSAEKLLLQQVHKTTIVGQLSGRGWMVELAPSCWSQGSVLSPLHPHYYHSIDCCLSFQFSENSSSC